MMLHFLKVQPAFKEFATCTTFCEGQNLYCLKAWKCESASCKGSCNGLERMGYSSASNTYDPSLACNASMAQYESGMCECTKPITKLLDTLEGIEMPPMDMPMDMPMGMPDGYGSASGTKGGDDYDSGQGTKGGRRFTDGDDYGWLRSTGQLGRTTGTGSGSGTSHSTYSIPCEESGCSNGFGPYNGQKTAGLWNCGEVSTPFGPLNS